MILLNGSRDQFAGTAAERYDLGEITDHASVYDALETMNSEDVDALLVKERTCREVPIQCRYTQAIGNSYRLIIRMRN